jgi:succinate dehydrogenase flavin-adding protein (antitoxin of CptAB toxin-antitoxin module)
MDILLQRFIRQHHAHLSDQDKSAFLRLLEQPDPDIMDWIMERQEAPADFRPLIGMIRGANDS